MRELCYFCWIASNDVSHLLLSVADSTGGGETLSINVTQCFKQWLVIIKLSTTLPSIRHVAVYYFMKNYFLSKQDVVISLCISWLLEKNVFTANVGDSVTRNAT